MPEVLAPPENPALRTSGRTLDHAAAVYDWIEPLITLGLDRPLRRYVIQHLALRGTERVLDIGCGTGTLTRQIARRLNPERSLVVGLDAATKMIDVARRKAAGIPNIRFDAEIAEDLPYENASFDAAVSTFFYHHICYDLKVRALNELWRVLTPGGRAVIVDVDTPTNLFGTLCAWSGYVLFQQDEIRENIDGLFRDALSVSPFPRWDVLDHRSGYITVFKLEKPQ